MNALTTTTAMMFGDMERLAAAIAKSGMFGMKTPEQALTLMAIAQAEGRHPALAARDYDVIQGRPSKKAEAMLRDFLEGGGKVEWHALSDEKADATFHHPQGGKVRIGWDMARANKAGLGGKDMWKKFPRQMLRSRTISEGVRTVWPMATSGLYEPGEIADFSGPTIEHEPEPDRRADREVPMAAAAATAPDRRAEINAEVPMPEPMPEPKRMTIREWLDEFEADCAACNSPEVADAILKRESVLRLDDPDLKINEAVRRRALAIRSALVARIWPQPPDEDDLPEVEIAGQEKAMSG